MKQKFLLSMLFGGALLAACTSDELDVAPVAQGVNPSAPVFSVSFEDGENSLTRASFSGGGVVYNGNDLMSLFHGIGTNGFTGGYQDAIYKAEGTENGLEFKTAAMVLPGKAVMVYPADTVNSLWIAAPTVAIPVEQDEDTVVYRPYVSPVLTIADRNAEGGENTTKVNGVSGYDKKYDIKMKSVAGLLRITLNANMDELQKKLDKAGVKATLAINSVELVNDDELFTIVMPIAMGEDYTKDTKPVGAADYWTAPITLAESATTKSPSLKTSYIRNNTAIFSVLPFDEEASFDDLKLVAHTTFGDVTITNETQIDEKEVVEAYTAYRLEEAEDLEEPISLSAAFDKLVNDIYATSYTGTFKDENAGQIVAMNVKMDMSTLNMNNMHIQDETALKTALNVYEALGIKENIRLILDGTKGKFEMSENTWKRVAKLMAEEEPKVTFAACANEAPCTAIVLSNDGEIDVPALSFDNKNYQADKIQRVVNVELAAKTSWTFADAAEKALSLSKVENLVVQKDATLNLTNKTVDVDNNCGGYIAFTLVNNGTVNVKGDVYLKTNMENFGTIMIGSDGENRLLMSDNGHLTNREPQGKNATISPVTEIKDGKMGTYGGVIENSGTLASVDGATNTLIENYGTINVNTAKARTLISKNADSYADIKKAFTNVETAAGEEPNRFGVINLQVTNAGNNNLKISENDGFIKSINGSHSKCNYAVCTNGNLVSKTYVELQYSEEVSANGESCFALIVPTGNSIFIPSNSSLSVGSYLYLKGSITKAAEFTVPQLEGYFGGDSDKDKNNIYTF